MTAYRFSAVWDPFERPGTDGRRRPLANQPFPTHEVHAWAWSKLLAELAELDPPSIPTASAVAWRIDPEGDDPKSYLFRVSATVEVRPIRPGRACRVCQSIDFLTRAGVTREALPRHMSTTAALIAHHLSPDHRGAAR